MKLQRGVATIAIVIAAALAVGAIGYVLLSRSGKVPAIPGLESVTFNDKCKYEDKDLCKFLNNFSSLEDYTITGTTTLKGESSGFVMKIDGENRYQSTFSKDGKDNYDTIGIDKTTYTKDFSDNKWFKSTATDDDTDIKDDLTFDDDPAVSKPAEDPKYTKIGSESCGKLTCLKYQVVTPGFDDKEFIWFDTKEYKLRKTETTSSDGSVTITDYSYTNVTVSAPSPVKEGSPSADLPIIYSVPEATVDTSADADATIEE